MLEAPESADIATLPLAPKIRCRTGTS